MERKFNNKVAVVTGGDSGIGRAIAEAYADAGATVIITYHKDEAKANAFSQALHEKDQKHGVYQLDVGDENDVRLFFKRVIKQFSKVDILVNNAGIGGSDVPVRDMLTETFEQCLRTNLYGPFFCSRAFLQAWKESQESGRIINITSVHEEVPSPGSVDYNTSKGALKNFSASLALELASTGITVNNIAPGMILTDMNKEALHDKKVRTDMEKQIPVGRAGTVDDIKAAAVFLASEESAYVTGTTLFIDGGLRLNMGQGA
ncbi:SDR family NAD(P)-dependent oxidoreductase [Sphingobacterium paludis]|uniref:Glucose 1-dehydrogenase n=1 Tax=Sphingobacterium paludis TaxID=1476465 RepID=A0A4R7CUI7_9SPHI|nr:glucose 1-dehydrogenase [Sphingobacterium paludis]TDS07480.1 glucose 1-dehydrogenase [Sphingobacterium paludis]